MHARQLAERRALQVDVQALALADEGAAVCCEVQYFLLGDFPDGLVDRLDVVRYGWDVLNGAIVCDDHVLHVVIPESEVDELAEEPWADNLEFSSKDTPSVNVAERE